jgi:hypothetical protein
MNADTKPFFCADCDSELDSHYQRQKDGRYICAHCADTIKKKQESKRQADLFTEQKTLFNPDSENRVLEYIKTHPGASLRDIAYDLKIKAGDHTKPLNQILIKLRNEGKISASENQFGPPRFKVNPGNRRRNVEGFVDGNGNFHPIRASKGYNEFIAGDFEPTKAQTKKREKEQSAYEAKELKAAREEAGIPKRSLASFVRGMGGMVPGGMYAGEIKRLSYKETGSTGLVNQHARQGAHKQTAEYVMDAANVEGYRDRYGERFTSIGDFLSEVEESAVKHINKHGKRNDTAAQRRKKLMAKATRKNGISAGGRLYVATLPEDTPEARRLIAEYRTATVKRQKQILARLRKLELRLAASFAKKNPHKSYMRLSVARTKKAARIEAKGKAITSAGAKRKDAQLMQKGQRMQRRGFTSGEGHILKGGSVVEGPVGRLPNGMFDAEAKAAAKQVERLRPVIHKQTKERGQVVKSLPGGFVKVAWDNGTTPSLIKRTELRLARGLKNPRRETIKQQIAKQFSRLMSARIHALKVRHPADNWTELSERLYVLYNGKITRREALNAVYEELREPSRSAKKKNPSVTEVSKMFQGKASGKVERLYAANGAPGNLARAGKLVFLKGKGWSVNPAGAIVAISPSGKLWICNSTKGAMFVKRADKGSLADYGEVKQICYETAKAHIGDGKTFEYVHTFGEDGGKRPRLLIDAEGMPILRGGSYKVKAEGIVN